MIHDGDDLTLSHWDSRTDALEPVMPIIQSHSIRPTTTRGARYKFCDPRQHTIAAVAWDGSEPIAITGVSIRTFLSSHGSTTGAFSCMTYVDPKFRGRGLIGRLLHFLEPPLANESVDFILALPNSAYAPVMEKSGYRKIADHTTSLTWPRAHTVVSAIRSLSQLKSFKPLTPTAPALPAIERFFRLTAETSNGFTTTNLNVEHLQYRLAHNRGFHYSIDFCHDIAAITSHGLRGKVREMRLIATAPRILSATTHAKLVQHLTETHRPDFISIRESAIRPPRVAIRRGHITLGARPPVYFRAITSSPAAPPAESIRLTGIDAHTW